MGTAASKKATSKSGLKKQENLDQYKQTVNQIMQMICAHVLADAPDTFDVQGRYERGDDPATTARAAYDAIEGDTDLGDEDSDG